MNLDPQIIGLGLVGLATAAAFVRVAARDRPDRRVVRRVATGVLTLAGLVAVVAIPVLTMDMRDF